MFPLICVWINGWVNYRDAGDLRHHRAHYDVTVIFIIVIKAFSLIHSCYLVVNLPLVKYSAMTCCWRGGGLSNCRAIAKVYTRILRIRDFTRSCDKTSARLVNRRPEWLSPDDVISWNYFSLLSSTSYWTKITDAGDLSHHDAHVTSQ